MSGTATWLDNGSSALSRSSLLAGIYTLVATTPDGICVDTAQIALTVGSSVTIKFYPEGTASSAKYYSGTAIVTGVSRSASFDGLVEASISVQGTGALTLATA